MEPAKSGPHNKHFKNIININLILLLINLILLILIPHSGGRGRNSVSSRPAWSTRASARTGSKATVKPCLKKKNRKIVYITDQKEC